MYVDAVKSKYNVNYFDRPRVEPWCGLDTVYLKIDFTGETTLGCAPLHV